MNKDYFFFISKKQTLPRCYRCVTARNGRDALHIFAMLDIGPGSPDRCFKQLFSVIQELIGPVHVRGSASFVEGMIVKRTTFALMLSLLFGGAAQAAAIDLDTTSAGVRAYRVADVSTVHRTEMVAPPPSSMSELPEPEVFAMMLVGLILIGYRASRVSSEKFK